MQHQSTSRRRSSFLNLDRRDLSIIWGNVHIFTWWIDGLCNLQAWSSKYIRAVFLLMQNTTSKYMYKYRLCCFCLFVFVSALIVGSSAPRILQIFWPWVVSVKVQPPHTPKKQKVSWIWYKSQGQEEVCSWRLTASPHVLKTYLSSKFIINAK